ncbi:MAG: class I SAM-dependent methyltransferase [Hyphomicrobiales bacterium]|nr:class I SAM-dependent methyltransferase [Hyphomicrobiales bacterium]
MAGLKKTLRKTKQAALEFAYRQNRSDEAFAWNWRATPINRIAVVNLAAAKFADCAYLEIGCDRNEVFNSVPVDKKVGVDPNRGGTIRTTSDAFFATNKERFDVIYIDGLHTYEQVHKDVANAMGCLNTGGWVILHDLLPHNWIEAHVPRIAMGSWTGDVWKVAFELIETAGVEFKIVKVDNGVGVFRITGAAPKLEDRSGELGEAQFAYLHENIGRLPLVEWREAQAWIRGT